MKILERFLIILIVLLSITLLSMIFAPSEAADVLNRLDELKNQVQEETQNILAQVSPEPDASKAEVKADLSGSFNPYYDMLDEEQQEIYGELYGGALNGNAAVTLNAPADVNDVQTAFESMYDDHPELFWLNSSYTYSMEQSQGKAVAVTFSYNDTADDLNSSKETFEHAVQEIVNGAEQYGSDYEKEKYVHDALRERAEYDLNAPLNQSAWSLLVNGETVCAGYARSFQLIMNRLGIPTYYVTGTSEGQDHAWNIVQLDGETYNVDVTWDDAASDADPYYFFNLSDGDFADTHERTGLSVNLPSCTSEAYAHLEDSDIWQYYQFVPVQ